LRLLWGQFLGFFCSADATRCTDQYEIFSKVSEPWVHSLPNFTLIIARVWAYGLFMAALRSRCGHYIFSLWFLSIFFYSSPNLSGRTLDACHISTHDVALVRIYNAGLKSAARGSLEIQNAKNRHLRTIT